VVRYVLIVETPQKCKDATTLNLNSGNSFMEICFWIFGFLDFWIFGFLGHFSKFAAKFKSYHFFQS